MSPDSMDSYRHLADEITLLREGVARIETKITTLCAQRKEAHEDHVGCRAHIDKEIDRISEEQAALDETVNKLTAWGKAVAIVGSICIAALTIINILLSIGVKL